jgi:hypothetical protein
MFRKIMSATLAALLTLIPLGSKSAIAVDKSERQASRAEKVKATISKLGVGREARITVRLRDKTKLAGYISEVRDDSFTITDFKTGESTVAAYPNITQIKGHNLSTGAKVAIIGLGIAVGILAFFLWLENAD